MSQLLSCLLVTVIRMLQWSVTDTVVERFYNSLWTTAYLYDLLGLFAHQYHVRPESECQFPLMFLVVHDRIWALLNGLPITIYVVQNWKSNLKHESSNWIPKI